MNKLAFYCLFVFLFNSLNVHAKNLNIAGTEWSPYNRVEKDQPGIITEYVELIVERIGMKANIELLPWSRAIKDVKSGRYDVLMSSGESDSKGLIKSEKLLDYKMCFFSLHTSNWNYNGAESLNTINLGSIQDYAYGEVVDSYLVNKGSNTTILKGDNVHKRLGQMLDLSRIDTFIADSMLVKYHFGEKYRESGCLQSLPLYLAFNKNIDPEIINKINLEISKTKEELEKLIRKYTSQN